MSKSERPDEPLAAADRPSDVGHPRRPRTIGRYIVERQLGQGGMGRVWLARDTVLERRVAIKVLRDDLALPPSIREELVIRMRHEARAAARVSHPNIVTLHDMGEDEPVGLYLVFEFVTKERVVPAEVELDADTARPESLRDRLREGRLPLAEVAVLARQLGDALTFAHDAGVVHRDVKPENVLFSATGAKVADFGIARVPDSTITRQNTVLGTPAYTAPEALSNGDFGPASDQFSLAATLYEAVTGSPAFAGESLVAVGKVAKEAPPPLDALLGSPALVKALSAALERGLAKTPDARFPSAASLGAAVARAIESAAPVDAPLFRTPLPFPRADVDAIEIERAPLSSRMAAAERAKAKLQSVSGPTSDLRVVETPSRASLAVRQRTERLQNILVAAALLVIVLLVVFGRKRPAPAVVPVETLDASPAAIAPVMRMSPQKSHRPKATVRAGDDDPDAGANERAPAPPQTEEVWPAPTPTSDAP